VFTKKVNSSCKCTKIGEVEMEFLLVLGYVATTSTSLLYCVSWDFLRKIFHCTPRWRHSTQIQQQLKCKQIAQSNKNMKHHPTTNSFNISQLFILTHYWTIAHSYELSNLNIHFKTLILSSIHVSLKIHWIWTLVINSSLQCFIFLFFTSECDFSFTSQTINPQCEKWWKPMGGHNMKIYA
jgi:hypothetical protein